MDVSKLPSTCLGFSVVCLLKLICNNLISIPIFLCLTNMLPRVGFVYRVSPEQIASNCTFASRSCVLHSLCTFLFISLFLEIVSSWQEGLLIKLWTWGAWEYVYICKQLVELLLDAMFNAFNPVTRVNFAGKHFC